ncbi:MAG: helix-turn-helix domain-containing protein [Saprospiraceae bacterium]|nr:helix-turn-helix domain-containing protein [Saprospiraceae bacterium]
MAGLRKGADAYLAKPFNPEELIATIQNLLETRKKLQLKYQQLVTIAPPINDVKAEVEDMEDLFIQKFKAVVNENISNSNFEMPDLEKALAMSRSQIYRKIKALTDKSPSQLIRTIRLQKGRHLLLTTQLTVSEIAYEVGYTAINNFSDAYLE